MNSVRLRRTIVETISGLSDAPDFLNLPVFLEEEDEEDADVLGGCAASEEGCVPMDARGSGASGGAPVIESMQCSANSLSSISTGLYNMWWSFHAARQQRIKGLVSFRLDR